MKTYVLMISRLFPSTHKRKGEHTFFPEMILYALKMHTIRANYRFWAKRIEEVQEGKAILSLRYWREKPYNSKQVEICQLDKYSGIEIQEIYFLCSNIYDPIVNGDEIDIHFLTKNDGLSLDDFKDWFKKYDLSKPMAIIHFTNFRY